MRLLVPTAVIIIWICVRMILPLRLSARAKAFLCLFPLLAGSKFLLYAALGGSFFSPRLPYAAMACGEVLYSSLIILFILLLTAEAYSLVRIPAGRLGLKIPAFPRTGISAVMLASAALAAGFWGFHEAVRIPDVRHLELRTPGLPESLDGMRIAQLTDLHIGPLLKRDWLEHVVDKTNGLNADIVVLTGDLVDGMPDEISGNLLPLGRLKSRYGIYGVTGNHEYYSDAQGWLLKFSRLGIRILRNEHAVPCEGIIIAGVPDPAEIKFGLGNGPNPVQAFESSPEGARILLSHRPFIPPSIPNGISALQLSGHTHGGTAFFLAPMIAAFNHGYVNGLSQSSGPHIYTSPGTGIWNGFSCRIGVPSEITLITLRSPNRND